MFIAFLAALVTSFVIPIDEAYFNYFDYKTLTCLFCVLAVVCALKNINFFYILARKIVHRFNTARICILALVYITFIGSMLIANDMALMTFLPLGYFVLTTTEKQKYMAFTFIMQNIAANLGGMLTPFGNPQNLYLYSKFNIPNLEFMSIMFIPFIASVAIITLCCIVFVKPEKLKLDDIKLILDPVRTVVYLLLFALSIAIVFRGIPYVVGLVVIPLALLVLDRKALKIQIDLDTEKTALVYRSFQYLPFHFGGCVHQARQFILLRTATDVSVAGIQIVSRRKIGENNGNHLFFGKHDAIGIHMIFDGIIFGDHGRPSDGAARLNFLLTLKLRKPNMGMHIDDFIRYKILYVSIVKPFIRRVQLECHILFLRFRLNFDNLFFPRHVLSEFRHFHLTPAVHNG
jgi:hypothetical protein